MRQRRWRRGRRNRRPNGRRDETSRPDSRRRRRNPAATERSEPLSDRGLQLSDRNGMRGRSVVRAAARGRRRCAGLRTGGPDGQWATLRAMDRLRIRLDLRSGSLPKALLRARLDRLRDERRALLAPASSPAFGQPNRRQRRLPLLPGQPLRRARTFVVCDDRIEHHLPDRRSDRGHRLLAGRYGRRRLSLPLQRRIYLRRGRLPKTLPRRAGRWRAFVSGYGRRLCPLQPRPGGRWRMHASLTLGQRWNVRSFTALARG